MRRCCHDRVLHTQGTSGRMPDLKRITSGWRLLRRRGIGYLWYLATGHLIPNLEYWLLYRLSNRRWRQSLLLSGLGSAAIVLMILSLLLDLLTAAAILLVFGGIVLLIRAAVGRLRTWHTCKRARLLTRQLQSTYTKDAFTSWQKWPIEPDTRRAVEAARKANPDEEITIARIGKDSRILGLFGDLPHGVNVGELDLVERHQYSLEVVLIGDSVLLRKDYHRDRARFLREWHSLAVLSAKANVPAVYRADENRCCLYKNFIPGKTINEILVDAGAKILNVQTDDDPELAGLDHAQRIKAVLARGTALIPSCVSEEFLDELERQLFKIHAHGASGPSLTFANVVVHADTGEPWLIDFDRARVCRSTAGLAFRYGRDRDRAKFNQIYGRELITETSARAALAAETAKEHWYAPVDFGNGLAAGGFWSTDSGTGRWEFFNRRVMEPLVPGKRILDLGSNNGVMPIAMLRAGAREVVGVEISPILAETARLVHKVFEWRDVAEYSFHVHNCDMREILQDDWGRFDLVTAFNSLYYLPADDMARVVRKASELAPLIVIQAKTDTRLEAKDNKAEKSSVAFLNRLLKENGFPEVEVFAPPDYSRPLLVASCSRERRPGLELAPVAEKGKKQLSRDVACR